MEHVRARPVVLVGETRSRKNIDALARLGWGRMFVTRRPSPFPFERWGFDNGAFIAYLRGAVFPEADFRRRLDVALATNSDPYLAVTPDIVAGGSRSLDFSAAWRLSNRLPDDWPWFLAVQDGMTVDDVKPHLHLYAGLFLGGSDKFKSTAYRWARLAHSCQKRFHYGRASTPRKLLSAFNVGADSCDSAFPLWTAARLRLFAARWGGLLEQVCLEFGVDAGK